MDGVSRASSVTIECDKGRYHTLNLIDKGMHMVALVPGTFSGRHEAGSEG